MRRSAFLAQATAVTLGGSLARSKPARADDAGIPDFDAGSYRRYLRRGDGHLDGTLAVQLADGTTREKGFTRVVAFPDGPYVRAWLRHSAAAIPATSSGSDFEVAPIPDPLVRFTRTTACDRDGNFYFDSLAHGEYIVRGHLTVAIPQKPPASTQLDADKVEIIDYVYLWLDSLPVAVTGTTSPDVVFAIAARRDRVQRINI